MLPEGGVIEVYWCKKENVAPEIASLLFSAALAWSRIQAI